MPETVLGASCVLHHLIKYSNLDEIGSIIILFYSGRNRLRADIELAKVTQPGSDGSELGTRACVSNQHIALPLCLSLQDG